MSELAVVMAVCVLRPLRYTLSNSLAKSEDAPKHRRYERNYAGLVQRFLDGPDDVTIRLQALRIGDGGIAAVPFWVFTEIGLEIKKKVPFADAFCN